MGMMIMTMTVVGEVAEAVGTCTKVGIQTRIASRITLGDSAFRITSFIVATIMAISWNATVLTPTAIGGASNLVEQLLFHWHLPKRGVALSGIWLLNVLVEILRDEGSKHLLNARLCWEPSRAASFASTAPQVRCGSLGMRICLLTVLMNMLPDANYA